jgi:hypothetical protein
MTRFYFDVAVDDQHVADTEGFEFPSLEDAKVERSALRFRLETTGRET